MWHLRTALILAFAGLAAAPGLAAAATPLAGVPTPFTSPNPMRVVIAHDATPGCKPNCADWISAEGDIVDATPAEFERVFKAIGGRRLPVFINSRGGSVKAAVLIGAGIRVRKLDVAVLHTRFLPCRFNPSTCHDNQPADGAPATVEAGGLAICASACPLILASGTERVTPRWSRIGVHQMWEVRTLADPKRLAEAHPLPSGKPLAGQKTEGEASEKIYGLVRSYFTFMGVDDKIVELMHATPHTSVRWLTRSELASIRLSTRDTDWKGLLDAERNDITQLALSAVFGPAVTSPGPIKPPDGAPALTEVPGLTLTPRQDIAALRALPWVKLFPGMETPPAATSLPGVATLPSATVLPGLSRIAGIGCLGGGISCRQQDPGPRPADPRSSGPSQ